MSIIKNNIKLFIAMLVALFIGCGICYFNVILSPQLEKIQALKYQNSQKAIQLSNLQQEFKRVAEREKQLRDMESQMESMNNKIPSYDMSVKIMMEIMQHMDSCNFQDLNINMGEPIKQENLANHYYKLPVAIKYTNTYTDTMNFLEDLHRSYQIITVDYFSIDNSIQEEINQRENTALGGGMVTTELIVWLYYSEKREQEKEYPNFIEFVGGEDSVFLRPNLQVSKKETEAEIKAEIEE